MSTPPEDADVSAASESRTAELERVIAFLRVCALPERSLAAAIWMGQLGWTLLIAGYFLAGFLAGHVEDALVFAAWFLGFYVFLPSGAMLLRRSWRHVQPSAFDELARDPRPPLLYLRAFDADHDRPGTGRVRSTLRVIFFPLIWPAIPVLAAIALIRWRRATFEERLVDALRSFGPVVAIARPGEPLPPIGAGRLRADPERWEEDVRALESVSRATVLRVGTSPGVLREMDLVRTGAGGRGVLVYYLAFHERGRRGTARAAEREELARRFERDGIDTSVLFEGEPLFLVAEPDGRWSAAPSIPALERWLAARAVDAPAAPVYARDGLTGPRRALLALGCVMLALYGIGIAQAVPSTMRTLEPELGATQERSAHMFMRSLSSAQNLFHGTQALDVDEDGVGEYGGFAELTGQGRARPGREPVLDYVAERALSSGVLVRRGYCFRLDLPGPRGRAVSGMQAGGGDDAAVDTDLAELWWCCYAWPLECDGGRRPVFFTNQTGRVLATESDAYCGVDGGPPADAAFAVPGGITSDLAVVPPTRNHRGIVWTLLR